MSKITKKLKQQNEQTIENNLKDARELAMNIKRGYLGIFNDILPDVITVYDLETKCIYKLFDLNPAACSVCARQGSGRFSASRPRVVRCRSITTLMAAYTDSEFI